MMANYLPRASLLLVLFLLLTTRVSEAQDPREDDVRKPAPAWCLDFSPDGSMLAATAGDRAGQGVLQVWNTRDWISGISLNEDRAVTCAAFSPDGRSLAFGTQKGEFALYDIPSKSITARWESGKWAVYGVTWTPNGQQIVGACANGVIKVWDATSRKLQITFDIWQADGIEDPGLRSHADRNQWDAAVTADGKTLLSGGWNDTTRLWSLETHQLIHAFHDEDKSTQGVKLLPDGKHFVSAGLGTGRVRIRDTQTLRERLTLPVSGRDLAVHPDGRLIAACSQTDVRVYRVNLDLPTPSDALRARAFIKQLDNRDPTVRASAVASLQELGSRAEPILHEALQSTSKLPTEQIRDLWEQLRTPAEVAVLGDLHGEIRQVAFSPTGKLLAISTMTGEIQVWSVPEFTLLQKFSITTSGKPDSDTQ